MFFEHLINDPAEMAAEGADRLVVLFALCSLLLIVALRLRDRLSMTIQSSHHRGLCPCVNVLGCLGPLVLTATVVQRGHAQV